MKKLFIPVILIMLAALAALLFDALQAKPERRILIEENYHPPAAHPAARPDAGLTPLPTPGE